MDTVATSPTHRRRRAAAAATLVLTLAACAALAAAPDASDPASHVRSTHARLRGALDHGRRHSRTLAGLIATLDASDVVVHLHDGSCDSQTPSCLRLTSSGHGRRILRVDFELTSGRRNAALDHYDRLVAQIAHELQHAVEIATDASVVDGQSLSTCFRRIGTARPTARGIAYETEAARRVGWQVAEELRGSRAKGGRGGGAVVDAAARR